MRRLTVAVVVLLAGLYPCSSTELPVGEYSARRQALRKELDGGAFILFGATRSEATGRWTGFVQESNFFYLTGWNEPGAALVVLPEDEVLFLPLRDRERERWSGPQAAPGDAGVEARAGVRRVLPMEALAVELPQLLAGVNRVYTLVDQPFTRKLRRLLPMREFRDARQVLARLRMRKSEMELAALRRSIQVTLQMHRAAAERLRPGIYEYQLLAPMAQVLLEAGCEQPAFTPIVGSGPNATILHYSGYRRQIQPGDLVVIDVGAECGHYAADVTRTLPASGRFTARQRRLYELVLGAQQAVIDAVKPGMSLGRRSPNSLYRIAVDYLNRFAEGPNGEPLGQFFTHGIGHHVGLDVHDLEDPAEALAAGMVITIEPGIYIPEEGIGIRIEDMVLVTEKGAQLLTGDLPRHAEEIEAWLRGRPWNAASATGSR